MDCQIIDRPLKNLILFKIQGSICCLECTFISKKTNFPCRWCSNSQKVFFHNQVRFLTQVRKEIKGSNYESTFDVDSQAGDLIIEWIKSILVRPACENCFCGSIIKLF